MQPLTLLYLFTIGQCLGSNSAREDSKSHDENEPSSALRPGLRPEDINKLTTKQCKELTVKEIERVLEPTACLGFTPECLEQFNLTNLNPDCAANIPSETIQGLSKKSMLELMKSDAEHIFFTAGDLDWFLAEYGKDIDDLPVIFVAYCARNKKLATSFIKGLVENKSYALLNMILVPGNIGSLEPAQFTHFSKESIAKINPQAFRLMTFEQMSALNPSGLAGLTATQLSHIPPKNFEAFNRQAVHAWGKETLLSMTVQQARFLGPDPDKLPSAAEPTAKGPAKDQQILDLRVFIDNHPCNGIKRLLNKYQVSKDVNQAISERCSPVWKPAIKAKAMNAKRYRENLASCNSAFVSVVLGVMIFILV